MKSITIILILILILLGVSCGTKSESSIEQISFLQEENGLLEGGVEDMTLTKKYLVGYISKPTSANISKINQAGGRVHRKYNNIHVLAKYRANSPCNVPLASIGCFVNTHCWLIPVY